MASFTPHLPNYTFTKRGKEERRAGCKLSPPSTTGYVAATEAEVPSKGRIQANSGPSPVFLHPTSHQGSLCSVFLTSQGQNQVKPIHSKPFYIFCFQNGPQSKEILQRNEQMKFQIPRWPHRVFIPPPPNNPTLSGS